MKTIEWARERVIANGNRNGLPWNEVVVRGIRAGQWDNGSYVREALADLEGESTETQDYGK